jgi:pyridoxal phosphate enzyme (YggS family)
MMSVAENIKKIQSEIGDAVTLVAVSKTKPAELILEAYNAGQRDFGENYIQELVSKYESLPKDIRWHMIGHVQSNKVKYIAPFVHLIHGVDSLKLLREINKQAEKNKRVIQCLLQVHIAQEETKFGFDADEIIEFMKGEEWKTLKNVSIRGLMTMGSNTNDMQQVEKEFREVKELMEKLNVEMTSEKSLSNTPGVLHQDPLQPQTLNFKLQTLSMGMSGDYALAIKCGSNMVRVGSLIFGERNYNQ